MDAVSPEGSTSLAVLRRVLRSRDLRRVEVAFAAFTAAEYATWVAILVYAYDAGGSTAVGVVALLQLAPAAAAAPFLAHLGDRHRRERVLAFGYVTQAAMMGLTAAALALDAPVALAAAAAAAANVAITVARPVHGGLLPSLADTAAELTAANVATGTVENAAVFAGPALAAVLLAIAGPGAVYGVMAALVLAGGVLVLGVRPHRGLGAEANGEDGEPVVAGALAGFRALLADRHSRVVVGLMAVMAGQWGALDVLLVVVGLELLDIGQGGVGWLNAAFGAGGLLGAAITVGLVGRPRLAPAFAAGLLLWAAGILLAGLAPGVALVGGMVALVGAGRSVVDVAGRTLLQRVIPRAVLSRVLGVLEGVSMGGLAAGSILAPAMIAVFGIRGALVAAGGALALLTALAWPRLAQADRAARVPGPELAVLRGVPLFAPLPAPVVERLAAALVPLAVPAGAAIVRQGDPGDRFYVIAGGRVRVTVDGRDHGERGVGDAFGEIALLRDVPRTATVAAATDVELLALEREDFLAAVTGHAPSRAAADAVIEARLAYRPDEPEQAGADA